MAVVVHHRKEPFDVFIARPSIWGNPYSRHRASDDEFRVETRAEAIEKYEAYVRGSEWLLRHLPELRGKRLGCWCAPKPCHGDVLVKLLAEVEAGTLLIPPEPTLDELVPD